MVAMRAALAALALLSFARAGNAEGSDAQARFEGPLGVRSVAAEVVRANPALRAAGEGVAAARAALTQAGAWPNPEVEASWTDDFAFASEGERSGEIGLAQPVPVAGRIKRARDVARADLDISASDAVDLARRLIGEAQAAAVSILALDRAIAARSQVIEATRDLARTSTQRWKAAEASEAEVNLLEIEVSSLDQEREILELERLAMRIALNRLMNRAPDAPFVLEGNLEAPLFDGPSAQLLMEESLRRRPDVARLQLEAEKAHAEVRLARAERWEDWTIGAGYQRDVSVIDDAGVALRDRDNLLALSVSAPLPLWNRNRGRIAAALAGQRAAAARLAALEQSVKAEVTTAFERVAQLRLVTATYQASILPRAERNVALLSRGYSQGLISVGELVQGQRQLAEASARLADTLGDLRQAEVALETAVAASPILEARGAKEPRP